MTHEDKKTALWTAGATAGLALVVAVLWFTGVME